MIFKLIPQKILLLGISFLICPSFCFAKNIANVWPLPPGEIESSDYQVEAGGKRAFVANATVLRGLPASFSSFEFSGTVRIKVTSSEPVTSCKILPAHLGITAAFSGNQLTFNLSQPANLTVELNGRTERALHLFANPIETVKPNPNDPNVIYFGPGVHEVAKLNPRTGQTIYLAAGAIVRAIIPPDEEPVEVIDKGGYQEKIYSPFIEAGGVKNVTISGRGILDLSRLPWHSRKAVWFDGSSNILIQGITLLDAPDWALVLHQCTKVTVHNVKQISWRENSDGVDICNSQNVTVDDSFIRANDDAISVKTISPPPAMKSMNVTVRDCIIWNERARALGITSETLADISAVTFQDCDVIHDFSEGGDCAALAILVSDSGTMSNISFIDIRIEDSRNKLIRCWIGDDGWSQDGRRGKIKGVKFDNISITGPLPRSEILGYASNRLIENVSLDLVVNGRKITRMADANIFLNSYVKNITISPN